MLLQEIRSFFPQLDEKVYGKPLVYLDHAATSLRPRQVIDKWSELSAKRSSNLHRAVHFIANEATKEYESARELTAQFLGAGDASEIVFTSGATASLNLVAFSFGEAFVGEGDEIIISEAEHHSDIVPWQMMCNRRRAVLKVLPVDVDGRIDISALPSLITSRTRMVCVAHVSNVLGIINPVKEIVNICHSRNCPVLIDGSQAVVHCSVNVSELGCDFYVFSGHKLYAAPGTGVLYGRKDLLDRMPPFMGGGEMIESVGWSGTSYNKVPYKFEAGTQNFAGTPTLKEAYKVDAMLSSEEVQDNAEMVKRFVYEALDSDPRITLFGRVENLAEKVALFSIKVEGSHHEDLSLILDKMGVAVRSGQMCAEPLMDRFGVTGMLRASFAPYNTMQEAEYFIKSLDRAIKMLQQ